MITHAEFFSALNPKEQERLLHSAFTGLEYRLGIVQADRIRPDLTVSAQDAAQLKTKVQRHVAQLPPLLVLDAETKLQRIKAMIAPVSGRYSRSDLIDLVTHIDRVI